MSLDLLKKSLKEDKIVYGFKTALKNLKSGKVSKIFLAKNCPQELRDEVKKYSNIEIIELKEPNKELALICKKKFSVNLLSAVKNK